MAAKSNIDQEVGRSLNRLRLERSLTVTALARTAGVSAGMISRIENGQVSPSLSTLCAIAEAISVPVMALLTQADQAADVHHVKAGQGLPSRRMTPNHSHAYQLLGKHGGPSGTFESARIVIERSDAGEMPRYQHEGYVFILITKGRASYRCAEEVFDLEEGDTLSFDAKLSHGFDKIKSQRVEFVTVSTRPQ